MKLTKLLKFMNLTLYSLLGKDIEELTEASVRRTYGVNVFAHFWTFQAFVDQLSSSTNDTDDTDSKDDTENEKEEDVGMVVNIASVMGFSASVSLSDYVSSKWAAVGLSECIRLENEKKGRPIHTMIG